VCGSTDNPQRTETHAGDHARAFRHLGRRGVQREKDEVAKNLIKRVSKGRRVASEPASNQG